MGALSIVGCSRITPMWRRARDDLRQYATVNLWCVHLFAALIPFGLLQEFERLGGSLIQRPGPGNFARPGSATNPDNATENRRTNARRSIERGRIPRIGIGKGGNLAAHDRR